MCPQCRSTSLMIKHRRGLEVLKIFFTGMRKYSCRDCGTSFRAIDRRKAPRTSAPQLSGLPRRTGS
jgi:hypothetical protein